MDARVQHVTVDSFGRSFNAPHVPIEFTLPPGAAWSPMIDTADGVIAAVDREFVNAAATVADEAHAVLILQAQGERPTGRASRR